MIQRELYMKRIRPFIGKDVIKVMTGIRRSGKSVMLELIKKELATSGTDPAHMISINFEDMRYAPLLTAESLHAYIQKEVQTIEGKVYLFFDEIQEVDSWEKCINSFRVEFDCDIYITGSNAKLLSGELATYLGGRYVEFVIYPFSLSEFQDAYRTLYPDAALRDIFHQYLTSGGMPYLGNLRYEEAPCRQYLVDVFNSILLKDIIKRNKIRDPDLLQRILTYVITNIGTTFSASTISKFLKSERRNVAPETILNYLRYCMDACLFYQAKRHDLAGKQILSTNEKYYIADHGIREAVYGGNMRDIHLILENMVFMEMLRRGYTVTVGKTGDKEIDFVGEKQGNLIYVQVTYLLASEETIQREFGVYKNIQDNFPKYVVSMDDLDLSRDGIRHRHIADFLTMENWD